MFHSPFRTLIKIIPRRETRHVHFGANKLKLVIRHKKKKKTLAFFFNTHPPGILHKEKNRGCFIIIFLFYVGDFSKPRVDNGEIKRAKCDIKVFLWGDFTTKYGYWSITKPRNDVRINRGIFCGKIVPTRIFYFVVRLGIWWSYVWIKILLIIKYVIVKYLRFYQNN